MSTELVLDLCGIWCLVAAVMRIQTSEHFEHKPLIILWALFDGIHMD